MGQTPDHPEVGESGSDLTFIWEYAVIIDRGFPERKIKERGIVKRNKRDKINTGKHKNTEIIQKKAGKAEQEKKEMRQTENK